MDDTVHFLSKYRRARREYGQGPEEAVRYAFDTAGRALFATTVVLVAGFLIFAFSPFVPTAQVGVLTAMIIAFALVADLSLLPALLTAVDRSSEEPKALASLTRRLLDSAASIRTVPGPLRWRLHIVPLEFRLYGTSEVVPIFSGALMNDRRGDACVAPTTNLCATAGWLATMAGSNRMRLPLSLSDLDEADAHDHVQQSV